MNIGIEAKSREALANQLSRLLADSYFVYQTTHGYHWNVTGPLFTNLHALFMEQYLELWNALDGIAERIRILGHYAPYTYCEFRALSKIEEHEGVPSALGMIQNLIKGQEQLIGAARAIIPIAEKAGDETTLDLVTQRLAIHEKNAWVLRSSLGA